jgi:hypothetical protein
MAERFRTGAFDPDFVAMLIDILRDACAEVEKASGQEPREGIRDLLAKAIMQSAEQGETNPAALKADALRAIPDCLPAVSKES